MAKSIEEQVEFYYKNLFTNIGLRIFGKTEELTHEITKMLALADSKSGGSGNNYPDIKFMLQNYYNRSIPVMVEAKGTANKLEKLDSDGFIEQIVKKNGTNSYTSITNYAVNGALHYGLACLNSEFINEVIIIGINGSVLDDDGTVKDPEYKAYYVSKKNNKVPKLLILDDSFTQFKKGNINKFFEHLDTLNLTEEEIKSNKERVENELDEKVHAIHQKLYDDGRLKNPLSTNEKLYLFCGLIMAGLKIENVRTLQPSDFPSNNDEEDNDGQIVIRRIKSFLKNTQSAQDKMEMIVNLLSGIFKKRILWESINGGQSIIKELYAQIQEDIIPLLESNWHLDFTGKILNRLSDWVNIDNDTANDVVLTPRYLTKFMARLARTNKDSYVWDRAMGSGGFLVSAMELMLEDAKNSIKDEKELQEKIAHIKKNQLLGVEILGNIFILAVLNMILMGDGSSKIVNGDSHKKLKAYENFPANVFLLNPPYSAPGKGFIFVAETLDDMCEIHKVTNKDAYACILIQENAGSGQGLPYTKNILKNNTLLASIHCPADVFGGKASVQAGIYLFQVARPHEEDDLVTFIDMSEDGYTRQNRKKSGQKVNLRDTDNAEGRYDEVVARILGKKAKTNYYTEDNGLLIKDMISLEGNDWTFAQHRVIDNRPTEDDFKKTVAEYLSWKVSQIMKEGF